MQIIDNRNNLAGLEIQDNGDGNWYVLNPATGNCIAVRYKQQAKLIVKNSDLWEL